jgi:transposase
MKKIILFSSTMLGKSREKVQKIEQLFNADGRLPPYMCALNPIELVRAKLKDYVTTRNVSRDISIKSFQEIILETLNKLRRKIEKVTAFM